MAAYCAGVVITVVVPGAQVVVVTVRRIRFLTTRTGFFATFLV
jgi:hypothetical protein